MSQESCAYWSSTSAVDGWLGSATGTVDVVPILSLAHPEATELLQNQIQSSISGKVKWCEATLSNIK